MAYKRYGKLNTVEDVVPVLEEMRNIQLKKKELKALHSPVIAGLEKTLAAAKKALKRALDRPGRRYDHLEAMVLRFAKRRREHLLSLQPGKTVKVDAEGGTISFRNNPAHIEYEGQGDPEQEAALIAQMEAAGDDRFVRIIKQIDVEALEREPEVAALYGFNWAKDEKIIVSP